MSSSIEFNRYVIQTPPMGRYNDEMYLGFCESGESNIRDFEGRIARHTGFFFADDNWRFMQQIVQISADCEGGMLKMNGRHCKPEGYIAAWRKEAKDAVNILDYLKQSPLRLCFYSLLRKLEVIKDDKYPDNGKPFNTRRRQEIDDLIQRFASAEGINETERLRFGETQRITEVTINRNNVNDILPLLFEVMENNVHLRDVTQDNFSVTAYKNAKLVRKHQKANAA